MHRSCWPLLPLLLLAWACDDGAGIALRDPALLDGGGGAGGALVDQDGGPDARMAGEGGAGGGAGGAGGGIAEDAHALYARLCAACHGPTGEGATGPALTGHGGADRVALADRIARTMPPTDPSACVDGCAIRLADLIVDALGAPLEACDPIGATPRRLRLLTRREYARTVTDLFFVAPDATGCERHTFRLDLGDRIPNTVHVAGSFNGWPGTIAEGGWPMARVDGIWVLERAMPPGRFTYKFVLDEREWIGDPANPIGEDDGFGGRNSVLEIAACAADGPPPGLADAIPAATRPEHFPFDTHAASGQVTAVHFEAFLAVAERVAEQAMSTREAWLDCDPGACPERFAEVVGRRVFRRPLTADEQGRYAGLVRERGARVALTALLVSPHFLYRSERGIADGQGRFVLDRYEMATALAYLFWGTTPDDALLDTPLDTPAQIAAAARAMLADPRAREMVGTFAAQWLGIEAVPTIDKSPEFAGDFGPVIRAALLDEARDFVADAVLDGGRYRDLMTAHSDPSAALAALYGDGDRPGVQSLGAVLATYAHSDQTSPIRRGLFVRRALLCQPLPPPPPNAGGVPDVDPGATTRERFRQHTADAFCASCHRYIDPVGFGFERYDPIGRWREVENGLPIDAAGDVTDLEGLGTGTSAPFAALDAFGDILAQSAAAPACFAIQLRRFALGRAEGPADRCAVSALVDQFAATGGDLQTLWVDLVSAPAFRTRVEVE